MQDYMINSNTLAIMPYGNKKALVYEKSGQFIINKRPNILINRNCMLNGSSLMGRLKGTLALTGYSYKAPIIIRDDGLIIFFPTMSPRLKECAWLNLNNLTNYFYDDAKKLSYVVFNDELLIELPISLNVINNQVLRATRLDAIVRKIKAENV